MIDPVNVPPIESNESVARYLLNKRNIRGDKTVKPEEFVPYKYVDLSVNRHLDCSDDEIWRFGEQVATVRSKKLLGRTDILVSDCEIGPLKVIEQPIENNPNHADITGYPAQKADQKALAAKLAACASNLIDVAQ